MKIKWLEKISNRRLDSVWYGGTIAEIEYKHYKIYIKAIGDIRAEINGCYYCDKCNGGCFKEYLFENNIRTDNQLEKANIDWLDNNWYEIQVWDNNLEDWVDNGIDNVIDLEPNEKFSWIPEWIKENIEED